MQRPLVKICCIRSEPEARMAIEAGASALGFVGPMPSGPGVIPEPLIRELIEYVPPAVATFLLTSETRAETIAAQQQRVHASTLQLVDVLEEDAYIQLRKLLPGIKLVQVVHVVDEHSLEEAVRVSAWVDAVLLDSGNPNLAVKELGGTGRTHDWDVSRTIREEITVPLFLAGGLNPDNIREAVQKVQPFAVDVCSGVRTNGQLDREKLQAFFSALL